MTINGLVRMTPTSIVSTGAGNSSSINTDGSISFTSCATLSLNGVFTASYENYMITMGCNPNGVQNSIIYVRLRASGTDNTSGYNHEELYAVTNTLTANRVTGGTSAAFFGSSVAARTGSTGFLFGPNLSRATVMRSLGTYGTLSNTNILDYGVTHSTVASYDGITFLPQSGTLSGLATVFGFNQ